MRYIVKKYFETGAAMIAIIAVLVFCAVVFQTLYVQKQANVGAVYPSSIVLLTNKDRDTARVSELATSTLLQQAAQLKANDMSEKGYFAHNSPEGKTPWYWLQKVGYVYNFAGENLAVNFTDSEKVQKAWMNSEFHRKNILDARFTEIGIATAKGEFNGKETVFVVQMFGNPKREVLKLATPNNLSANVSAVSFNNLLSNPYKILMTVYSVLGLVVLLALLTYIGSEWKQHHIRHVLYGSAILLLLILGIIAYGHFFAVDVAII